MCGHPHRRAVERAKRCNVRFKFFARGMDMGQFEMAVDDRAAMPGHMLDNTSSATLVEPVEHRTAKRGNTHRIKTHRPITNGCRCVGYADIEDRQEIDGDPNLVEYQSQCLCINPRCLNRGHRGNIV